jgi:hypothetical protein
MQLVAVEYSGFPLGIHAQLIQFDGSGSYSPLVAHEVAGVCCATHFSLNSDIARYRRWGSVTLAHEDHSLLLKDFEAERSAVL